MRGLCILRCGLGLLLAALLPGCSGGGQQGEAYFYIDWPAQAAQSRADFSGMRSMRIEVMEGKTVLRTVVVDRPALPNPSIIPFLWMPCGEFTFRASAYDAIDGAGTVLGQASGALGISDHTPTGIRLSATRHADIRLVISPLEPQVRVGKTLLLHAQAQNPDGGIVLLPPDTLRWTTSDPRIGIAHSTTGVLTGIQPGQAIITATEVNSGLLGKVNILVTAE